MSCLEKCPYFVRTTDTMAETAILYVLQVIEQFEGASRGLVTRRLGMETRCPFQKSSKWDDVCRAMTSLGDLRYFVWMVGTVLSDMVSTAQEYH